MSVRVMAEVWELDLPQPLKLLALALADWADDEGGNIWPSIDTMARKVGAHPRTVQRQLRLLEESGLVRIEHGGGGRGRTRRLRLQTQKGDKLPPIPKRVAPGAQKGGTGGLKGGTAMPPDPLIEPSLTAEPFEFEAENLPPLEPGESRRDYLRRITSQAFTMPPQGEPHPRPGQHV